ncbi:hypothetical protein PO124_14605 [Bacillus licheniformis]|nr:hypothetical protein [Bacillus licheniformis]
MIVGYGTDEAREIDETALKSNACGRHHPIYRAGGGGWGNPLEREPERCWTTS